MKFDDICKYVLVNEADYDTLTGQQKVFSLAPGALKMAKSLTIDDIKPLIKRTALPFDLDYIKRLVIIELENYLPAEKSDIIEFLTKNIYHKFDDTEKKSQRAAQALFPYLKSNGILVGGIPKKSSSKDDSIEKLATELENDIDKDDDEDMKLGIDDVERLGGSVERGRGHPEDESIWGNLDD